MNYTDIRRNAGSGSHSGPPPSLGAKPNVENHTCRTYLVHNNLSRWWLDIITHTVFNLTLLQSVYTMHPVRWHVAMSFSLTTCPFLPRPQHLNAFASHWVWFQGVRWGGGVRPPPCRVSQCLLASRPFCTVSRWGRHIDISLAMYARGNVFCITTVLATAKYDAHAHACKYIPGIWMRCVFCCWLNY